MKVLVERGQFQEVVFLDNAHFLESFGIGSIKSILLQHCGNTAATTASKTMTIAALRTAVRDRFFANEKLHFASRSPTERNKLLMEHFWTTLEEELNHITFEEGDTLYIQDSDFGRAVPLQKFVQLLKSSTGGTSSTKCLVAEMLKKQQTGVNSPATATLHQEEEDGDEHHFASLNSLDRALGAILGFQEYIQIVVVPHGEETRFAQRGGLELTSGLGSELQSYHTDEEASDEGGHRLSSAVVVLATRKRRLRTSI